MELDCGVPYCVSSAAGTATKSTMLIGTER
jgi:hypothetical protein